MTLRKEILVSDLCEEIDAANEAADYWRKKYEDLLAEYNLQTNERLEEAMRGIGQALMFALHVKDDTEGNLIITKDDRAALSETFKTN